MTTTESLLRQRLKEARANATSFAIPSRSEHEPTPLSHAQEHLWLLAQMAGTKEAFNRSLTVQFDGQLKIAALQDALSKVVARHDVLRSSFHTPDGGLTQTVSQAKPIVLPVVDLKRRKQSKAKLQRAANRQMRLESRQPFDLETGPLFRVVLYRLSEIRHVLHFVVHHVVCDGWSDGIFLRDVSTEYRAIVAGETAKHPGLPIQYADFASWQRNGAVAESAAHDHSFWQEALKHAPRDLRLPLDRSAARNAEYDGRKVITVLPTTLVESIKDVARRCDATLFMTLLAAFQTLLYRYSGDDDIIVGTPVANRSRSETRELVGLFLNTLAIRTDLSGNPTFTDLLARVRRQTLAALSHQQLPFAEVLKTIANGHHGDLPVFRTMMQLRNMPHQLISFGEVKAKVLDLDEKDPEHARLRLGPVSRVPLALDCVERGGEIICCFEYDKTVLRKNTVTQLASHFETLLGAIGDDPTARLLDLRLLTQVDTEKVLTGWNGVSQTPVPTTCVHQMFESQAHKTPQALAIIDGHAQLTYAELNERASHVAARLEASGIGPGNMVGVCIPRSIDMIVGLLGVLKSGAGYVPLDSNYPRRRLEFMLDDAGPEAVVMVRSIDLPSKAREDASLVRIDVDAEDEYHPEPPECLYAPTPDDTAYMIYTSGSTGRPKGVMVDHRALSNYTQCAIDAFALGPHDRVLQFASIGFDTSAEEIFPTLAVGATLVLRDDEMIISTPHFFHACAAFGVTVLDLPTAYWHELIHGLTKDAHVSADLRLVVIGGERVSAELLDRWKKHVGDEVVVVNTYGPTEATIVATMCDVVGPHAVEIFDHSVPIGAPVRNVRIYVLDERRKPVPHGVIGELYIGGVGVALGYLGQPQLTAECFLTDPFDDTEQARMYRTGDVVRFRTDGVLEFKGRLDDQVKVRGHRIELGEIEAVLREHGEVEMAVVTVGPDDADEKHLVAHVVCVEGYTLTTRKLRDFLGARLPDYMIPQRFAGVATLPVNQNGKIDRRALPDPLQHALESGGEFVDLNTPTERQLGGFWGELLPSDRIGANDDFFDLGGHSLLATRLATRVREYFAIDLPLKSVFENRTVASLAQHVDKLVSAHSPDTTSVEFDALRAVTPAFHNGGAPLSFAQSRLWYLDQLQPNNPAYNIPFALKMNGALNVRALEQSLAEIVRRHEVLRSRFVLVGDAPTQVVDPMIPVTLAVTDLSGTEGVDEAARRTLSGDACLPFDLAHGPLIRVRLLQLAERVHVLGMVIHHIAADGWSFDVLLRELEILYKAFSTGRRLPLGPPVLQYSDFAVWQAKWTSSESYGEQLAYWRHKLHGELPTLDLPTDRLRPCVQSHRGSIVAFDCPSDLTNTLDRAAAGQDATLFMVLFAAFNCLLQRYTGQDDLLVGTPIANRNRPEIEGLIGFFANTLVLRTDLGGAKSFADVVRRVRNVCLEAYDNQDIPFEQIVEELQPTRDLSRTPLFQTMFVYQEALDRPTKMGDVAVERFEFATTVSRTDLYVWIQRTPAGLRGFFEYNTDLFDAATVRRMMHHYQVMLGGVCENIHTDLGELPLLSSAEHDQLVTGWNNTRIETPACCVHELFERQAIAHRTKVAVRCGNQTITYGELDGRANQVARHLQALGVGGEQLVGVSTYRSVDMMVAVLGVLKAGAAYVPLDPAYPDARLEFMVKDSGLTIVLTEEVLRERFSKSTPDIVCLDSDWPTIAEQVSGPLGSPQEPGCLAYVIYTSGSTGTPKGVEIQHDSVVNFLESMRREPGLDEHDVLFAVTTLSFDISVLELFLPLIAGAQVVIGARNVIEDGAALASAILQAGVTVMQATPATWRMLLAADWQPQSRIKALCGGEPLPMDLAGDLLQRVGALWNMYGPTETTIWSTCQMITNPNDVAIGRPIANTNAYVLDRQLRPVPLGVTGELYIGGAGVARGYRGRPELTGERFVVDPFVNHEGSRMYRTGDWARRNPNGSIDCLGRVDYQVKIRGHRIELGEVEFALATHPAVRHCVTLVRNIRPGDARLVAYVVYAASQTATAAEMRKHVRATLPSFMIPQHFVVLEEFPLTDNGKVDRKALPSPFATTAAPAEYAEPETETERRLAIIWQEILGVQRVDRHANFFELGGHSLLSMGVIGRITAELGPKLSPRVMVLQTLAQIAAECDRVTGGVCNEATPTVGLWSRLVTGMKKSAGRV